MFVIWLAWSTKVKDYRIRIATGDSEKDALESLMKKIKKHTNDTASYPIMEDFIWAYGIRVRKFYDYYDFRRALTDCYKGLTKKNELTHLRLLLKHFDRKFQQSLDFDDSYTDFSTD